ncbi:SDR family NAD(P)-dependent oxidoreductase [Mucilaginibacter auburnensis]|uniref:3-oxoacyl-[acyl-carrier protein] reductase n=1 Tax=Mucilaginibacter auburnensis TaxID=1457233 RepID=A0A2H9VLQ8_9SPHI|nr:3-oxoacyl-ACP reductase family protein [Mucilaginibacter auburnensis]PJJ79277.1 3-oxoacyl-[acyl-carrier protein] reductase [Mucilaginibacter auburnensis]
MKKLANKVALVTGGSRGIGAAIVRKLAADGASVAFTYTRSAEKAEALAAEIQAAGGKALALQADSAQAKAVIDAVNTAVASFDGLDILVNNAGIYVGKDFAEHTIEDYDEIMAVNVKAVYVAALEAVKHLKSGGRIITIGSNMGDNAIGPQTTLYTMSKSALHGLTRGLARDLGPKGINVTLVQPGPIDTDMNPANTEFADFLRSKTALGRYGTGEDIAGLVSFLASEESKYITGSWVTIDGGFNA